MSFFDHPGEWVLSALLILSLLGVISTDKPVYSALSFLFSLLSLAALYLQLSAGFISVMQVLVYAGAILVIFMFVIVLFQDAHQQISQTEPKSSSLLLILSAGAFLFSVVYLIRQLIGLGPPKNPLPEGYGTVQSIGHALYLDFFFPFELLVLLFLIAMVGALYIGKKEV